MKFFGNVHCLLFVGLILAMNIDADNQEIKGASPIKYLWKIQDLKDDHKIPIQNFVNDVYVTTLHGK